MKGEIFVAILLVQRYFTLCQLLCIGILKIVPTSSLLAFRIWGLLFLWLAHLHNKNNVYDQEISQRKLQLLIFISWVLAAFSWNLHHFQSSSSLQSGSGSISVPDQGGRGGEAASKKIVSQPFQPQFGLKIRGRPRLLPWVRH